MTYWPWSTNCLSSSWKVVSIQLQRWGNPVSRCWSDWAWFHLGNGKRLHTSKVMHIVDYGHFRAHLQIGLDCRAPNISHQTHHICGMTLWRKVHLIKHWPMEALVMKCWRLSKYLKMMRQVRRTMKKTLTKTLFKYSIETSLHSWILTSQRMPIWDPFLQPSISKFFIESKGKCTHSGFEIDEGQLEIHWSEECNYTCWTMKAC